MVKIASICQNTPPFQQTIPLCPCIFSYGICFAKTSPKRTYERAPKAPNFSIIYTSLFIHF